MKTAVLVFLFLLIGAALPAETIVLAADSWMPFNGNPTDNHPGFVVELARSIFLKKGITIDYQMVPWTRAVDGTGSGIYTAAIGAMDGDVKGAVLPEEPIGLNNNVFYVRKADPWVYKGLDSLSAISLGLVKDYTYDSGAFDHWASSAKTVQWAVGEDALDTNLKKLNAGHLDAVLDNQTVLVYRIRQLGLGANLKQGGALSKEAQPLYIAFSPKDPKSKDYARILSEGIREMRANGSLKTLLAEYGVKDWK